MLAEPTVLLSASNRAHSSAKREVQSRVPVIKQISRKLYYRDHCTVVAIINFRDLSIFKSVDSPQNANLLFIGGRLLSAMSREAYVLIDL